MKLNRFIAAALGGAVTVVLLMQVENAATKGDPKLSVVEVGITEMQAAMKQGKITSQEIVHQYLTRIALYEGRLNAAIALNPNALKEAESSHENYGIRHPSCNGSDGFDVRAVRTRSGALWKTGYSTDWQAAAGGKMSFEVASVKASKSNAEPTSNFPLGPGDVFAAVGGRFCAALFQQN